MSGYRVTHCLLSQRLNKFPALVPGIANSPADGVPCEIFGAKTALTGNVFPDNAVDFILTDPPYLVGFRDRQGRTIAGDKTDEWLQPASHEMYRVLKKDALLISFYGWNRVDRFMAAWKKAGFSVVGHLVFTKTYTSKAAYWRVWTPFRRNNGLSRACLPVR